MIRPLALFSTLALAACAQPGVPTPDSVGLKGDVLTLRFPDGTVCRAEAPGSTSGNFPGCRHDARFELRRHANPGPAARSLPEFFEPFADITITLPDGRRHEFMTPASRSWSGWLTQDD
ncbi:MAG: hypothetical protein Q4G36_01420 [Paracoccus sp. (in: a-proteobacteria)]|nr:hypothetical protein [Paracoccus sp. (in: a-proteobacteria)]